MLKNETHFEFGCPSILFLFGTYAGALKESKFLYGSAYFP
jgi:hypothetical protein